MSKKSEKQIKGTQKKTTEPKPAGKKGAAPAARDKNKVAAAEAAPPSRVGETYRKIGTDKLYRIVQDHGGRNVRVIRVMPDGSTKGDEMMVNLSAYEPVKDGAATTAKTAAEEASTTPAKSSAKSFQHDPRVPPVGTTLKKEYKGKILEVTVEPDGFGYDGKRWRSLTGITREVTGISNPNGYSFFELNGEAKRRSLDVGAVKFALSLLPSEYAPLRNVEIESTLASGKAGACADAAERLEKARTLLGDSAKALGAALRVVNARRAELEKATA